MKTQTIFFGLLFSFISVVSLAQSKAPALKSEEIKVWGNCGMCKSTIEKAAKAGGASSAIWNEDTKLLKVKYASAKTNAAKIQQKIADAGYDTKDLTGKDEAYNNLHECCKYDRKATASVKHDKDCCSSKECTASKDCCTDKCAKDTKDCCTKTN